MAELRLVTRPLLAVGLALGIGAVFYEVRFGLSDMVRLLQTWAAFFVALAVASEVLLRSTLVPRG